MTLANLSMHAGTAVLAGASCTTTLASSAAAVYGGITAYEGFASEIAKRKGKNARIASLANQPGTPGDAPGPVKGELIAVVYRQLETFYAALHIKDPDGKLKTSLLEIRRCQADGCECPDYQGTGDSAGPYLCGHRVVCHYRIPDHMPDHVQVEMLVLFALAVQVYPTLQHEDSKGLLRKDLKQLSPCTQCGCTDYRLGYYQHCHCHHGMSSHQNEPPASAAKLRETIVEILAESLYQQFKLKDDKKRLKKCLYEIEWCQKSGCKDFDHG